MRSFLQVARRGGPADLLPQPLIDAVARRGYRPLVEHRFFAQHELARIEIDALDRMEPAVVAIEAVQRLHHGISFQCSPFRRQHDTPPRDLAAGIRRHDAGAVDLHLALAVPDDNLPGLGERRGADECQRDEQAAVQEGRRGFHRHEGVPGGVTVFGRDRDIFSDNRLRCVKGPGSQRRSIPDCALNGCLPINVSHR